MSALKVETDSLHLSDPTRSRSMVHVGIAHPTPLEESAFGKLYLLTEVDSADRINQDVVVALQDTLRSTYYRSTEFSVETAFEAALQAGNRKLHDFISNGVTDWVDHFHAIVAVVKNDLVTISSIGRMHAFLFRGTRITDISGRAGQPEEKRNPLKMFSSVLSGRLQRHDRLLLSTSSLLDFFSQEKLKRLIVADLPSATLAKIEQALMATPTPVSFGAILFAFLEDSEASTISTPNLHHMPIRANTAPQRSMEDLVQKERATEELLSPKLMPNVGAVLSSVANTTRNFVRQKVFGQPPRRTLDRSIRSTSRFSEEAPRARPVMRRARRIGARFLLLLLALPRWLASLNKRQRTVTSNVKELPQRATGRANAVIRWVRTLTPRQGLIIVGAVIALFILSQSVISMSTQGRQALKGEALAAAITKIEDNLDRAEAALTYDDTAGARRLVDESVTVVEQLPNRSKSDKNRVAGLENRMETIRQQARRVVTPSLTTVSDDGLIAEISPRTISLAGTSLIVAGRTADKLVRVGLTDQRTISVDATLPETQLAATYSNQAIIFSSPQGQLREFLLQNSAVRNLTIVYPNADRDVRSAAIFQSRLYLLDAKNDSILRANRGANSFGTPTQWLRDTDVDLADTVSLAVDGSLYVLRSNGEIMRFSGGTKDDVSFVAADPALASPTILWTNEQADLLYVLEPSQGRLVTFDKTTRQPKKQFVHDDLKAALSMAINPTTSTVYLLTEGRILSFPAN